MHEGRPGSDLVSYLADAISRTELGDVTSPSGSHLAGIFGTAARKLEKEIQSFVEKLLTSLDLGNLSKFRRLLSRLEERSLGHLIEATREAVELRPESACEMIPEGFDLERLREVNEAWINVKHHGLELNDAILLAHMKTMYGIAQLLARQSHRIAGMESV
jgi:hypothetical protein